MLFARSLHLFPFRSVGCSVRWPECCGMCSTDRECGPTIWVWSWSLEGKECALPACHLQDISRSTWMRMMVVLIRTLSNRLQAMCSTRVDVANDTLKVQTCTFWMSRFRSYVRKYARRIVPVFLHPNAEAVRWNKGQLFTYGFQFIDGPIKVMRECCHSDAGT